MLMTESLICFHEYGNLWALALAHMNLGEAAFGQGDIAAAAAQFAAAHDLLPILGDSDGAALTLWYLGRVARLQGDSVQATSFLNESLKQLHDQGNRIGTGRVLLELGRVARMQG